ncbi:flagellar protein FlgN [Microvirga rosea]|uniref:flagellar protein FlgN n=1 Tax=Microvirga rosea TaxID=2715425 RepID=UPI001D0AB729|nr:flagellar protein FlgN [Microvirga rosea]MCB8823463.1 flagellar protein FlgN [Microvirga rosea]
MLTNSIERLEEIIDAETAALLAHIPIDHQEFNRRKSQSLLELTRLVRVTQSEPMRPEIASRLQDLKAKLDQNHAVLEMNLRAVQEVANIVSGAIQSAESDGTYTAGAHHIAYE